jgi:hypothetical protein
VGWVAWPKVVRALSSSAASRGVASAGDFAHHSKPLCSVGKAAGSKGQLPGGSCTYREAAPHGGPCPGPSQGAGLGWEAREQHLRHASSTLPHGAAQQGVGCHTHNTHTGLGHTGPGHAALVHTQRCLGYASAAPGHGRCAPACTLGLGEHAALGPTRMHQYWTHTTPECVECKALGVWDPGCSVQASLCTWVNLQARWAGTDPLEGRQYAGELCSSAPGADLRRIWWYAGG